MDKRVIYPILILIISIIILVSFVIPLFNFAIFDSQCYDMLTECITIPAFPWAKKGRILVDLVEPEPPETFCSQNCKVRHFKCSFDQEFQKKCLDCIQNCKSKFNSDEVYINCTKFCTSKK